MSTPPRPTGLLDLPPEIILHIVSYCLPSEGSDEPYEALFPLGFRCPYMESPICSVFITLPSAALRLIYRDNPAGESKGRFWPSFAHGLGATCKSLRSEVETAWAKKPVKVGTWMTYLQNRPACLLADIQAMSFQYYALSWFPSISPVHNSLAECAVSLLAEWTSTLDNVYMLETMTGVDLAHMRLVFCLAEKMQLHVNSEQRLKHGFALVRFVVGVIYRELVRINARRKWPTQLLVMDLPDRLLAEDGVTEDELVALLLTGAE